MTSLFAFMNLFLVALTVLSVFAPKQISAAVCSQQTNHQCVLSDFTLTTCNKTSLVCDCSQGFQPISTGCAKKLVQPSVALSPGRINQRVPNAPVKLTCVSSEQGTLTFEWKKNGTTLAGETQRELNLQGNDTIVLGKYSCMVKETTLGLTSDFSLETELLTFNANGVTPVVTGSTQSAAPGVVLDVLCAGIPYGATYKFKLTPPDTMVDTVKQDSTKTDITCVLEDITGVTWTAKESAPFKMPTEALDITAVTISPSQAVTLKPGASLTFTCGTTPEAKFMETATSKMNYTFLDTGNAVSTGGSTYTLTSTAASKTDRTVSCSARYGEGTLQESAKVLVSFNDSYITTPSINASSTTVSPGSRLTLICLADPIAQLAWVKDGKTIARETERLIQIGNFQPTDAGKYVCTATIDSYTADSQEFVITSEASELRAFSSAITVLAAVLGWRFL